MLMLDQEHTSVFKVSDMSNDVFIPNTNSLGRRGFRLIKSVNMLSQLSVLDMNKSVVSTGQMMSNDRTLVNVGTE